MQCSAVHCPGPSLPEDWSHPGWVDKSPCGPHPHPSIRPCIGRSGGPGLDIEEQEEEDHVRDPDSVMLTLNLGHKHTHKHNHSPLSPCNLCPCNLCPFLASCTDTHTVSQACCLINRHRFDTTLGTAFHVSHRTHEACLSGARPHPACVGASHDRQPRRKEAATRSGTRRHLGLRPSGSVSCPCQLMCVCVSECQGGYGRRYKQSFACSAVHKLA